jgi:hypothetical protein
MSPKLEFHELAITIAANNYSPAFLNLDFLVASDLIPPEWKLAQQPIVDGNKAQLSFENGVNLMARRGAITFAQPIAQSNLEAVLLPQIAERYVHKLPAAGYQMLSINPRSLYPLGEEENAARNYISENLIAPTLAAAARDTLKSASVNLIYQLEDSTLTLNISPARLEGPKQPAIGAVFFSGNFNYSLANYSSAERLSHLSQLINGWSNAWEKYQQLLAENFAIATQAKREIKSKLIAGETTATEGEPVLVAGPSAA